jgi:hypothetical protein
MVSHTAVFEGHRRAGPRLTTLTLTGLTLTCLLIGSAETSAPAGEGRSHSHLSPVAYSTHHLSANRSGYLMIDEDECDPTDPVEMEAEPPPIGRTPRVGGVRVRAGTAGGAA